MKAYNSTFYVKIELIKILHMLIYIISETENYTENDTRVYTRVYSSNNYISLGDSYKEIEGDEKEVFQIIDDIFKWHLSS